MVCIVFLVLFALEDNPAEKEEFSPQRKKLPGVAKECFLEALKYLKTSKQHPFEIPWNSLVKRPRPIEDPWFICCGLSSAGWWREYANLKQPLGWLVLFRVSTPGFAFLVILYFWSYYFRPL